MAIADTSVGLLFRIRADGKQAKDELKEVSRTAQKELSEIDKQDLSKASGGLQSLAGNLSAIAPIAGAVAVGIGAVVTATIAASAALFNLAKDTAEYAKEIDNFNKLTSFSVETIQALKIAAEKTGGSLEEIEEVFESFVELMIEGGEGADDAKKKLVSLGLDPKKAYQDLEGSFLKVLDKIREMPTQSGKAKVAMDGMGESGLAMVKVADAMTGGTKKYIETLKEQGLLMDAEGIRKSKQFASALGELEKQAASAAREFAIGFMPAITAALQSVSGSLKGNKSVWQEWGEFVGKIIFNAVQNTKLLMALMRDLANRNFSLPETQVQAQTNEKNAQNFEFEQLKSDNSRKATELGAPSDADLNKFIDRKPLKESEDAEKKRNEERLALAKADTAAQIAIRKNQIDSIVEEFEKGYARLAELYKENGDATSFKSTVEQLRQNALTEINSILPELDKFQNYQANIDKKTALEKQLLSDEQVKYANETAEKIWAKWNETEKLITEGAKANNEKKLVSSVEFLRRQTEFYEEFYTIQQEILKGKFEQGLIDEESYLRQSQKLTLDFAEIEEKNGQLTKNTRLAPSLLNFKRSQLEKELELVKDDAVKKTEIEQKIALLNLEINRVYFEQKNQFRLLDLEREKAYVAESDAIQKEQSEIENRKTDLNFENDRKRYQNLIDANTNKKENLQGLYELELGYNQILLDRELAKQKTERETYEKSVEGLKNAEELKKQIRELYAQQELLAKEEFAAREAEINKKKKESETEQSTAGKLLGGLLNRGEVDIAKAMGQELVNTMNSIAEATGNAVVAFIKFGTAGGSFRKFAAEMIASIAKMAVVQAIWNTAEGFAKLALAFFGHPTAGTSAAQHFTAAAIYAGIAGVATVAGRGIAGDSFKNTSAQSATQNGQNTRTANEQQAANQKKVIEEDRNRAQNVVRHVVELRHDKRFISATVLEDFQNRGETYGMIIQAVEG